MPEQLTEAVREYVRLHDLILSPEFKEMRFKAADGPHGLSQEWWDTLAARDKAYEAMRDALLGEVPA